MDKLVDAAFLVEKDKETKISTVEHKWSREEPIDNVMFRHDSFGMPQFIPPY